MRKIINKIIWGIGWIILFSVYTAAATVILIAPLKYAYNKGFIQGYNDAKSVFEPLNAAQDKDIRIKQLIIDLKIRENYELKNHR